MWPLSRANRGEQPAQLNRPPADWLEKNSFILAGEYAPLRLEEFDIWLSGGKATGKSTVLTVQMTSHINAYIAAMRPFNMHAYTPKPDDFYPLLKALYEPLGISVRATNPFIKDSWAWDAAASLTSLPRIDVHSAVTIKDDAREQNPFFKKAAQLTLRGVVQSLGTTHPGLWTMRHVALILRDLRLAEQVLDRCEHTKHLLSLLAEEQGTTAANLHATLLAELKGLELVASLIDQTPDDRRFTAEEAANAPGIIWVWGSDPRFDTAIEPWNAIQLELIGHELLIRGNIGMDTLLYLDEFPQLAAGGGQRLTIIKKVLEWGRSSRVRSTLAVQTPAQVVEIYGEHGADTLLGQVHNAVVFRHADSYGQTYWSRRLGRERGFEAKRNRGRQVGGSRGLGNFSSSWSVTEGVSYERFDLERVTPSDINDLPVGTYEFGIFGYASVPLSRHINPATRLPEPIRWRFHLTPEWIRTHVPKPTNIVPYAKSLKPESSYTLTPLQEWEYGFLGLRDPSR